MKEFVNSAAFIVIMCIVSIVSLSLISGIYEILAVAFVFAMFLPVSTWKEKTS